MTPPRITLSPFSNVAHLQQLFAGFEALHDAGEIRLAYRFDGPARFGIEVPGILDARAFLIVAEVADGPTVSFDTHDSAIVCEPLYAATDLYLKRSYNADEHGGHAHMAPLGPNYEVERDKRSLFALIRALKLPQERGRGRAVARALRLPGNAAVSEAALPVTPPSADPRILFVTRAWNPQESKTPDAQKTRDRLSISAMRAECVRSLRATFGERFTGGLYRDSFALEHYPDAVVPDGFDTGRSAHLARLTSHDICISSAGLHRSVGWKFAEYLATGRAVVAEHMAFEAPGELTDGTHFIGFSTPEDCVKAVGTLVEQPDRRYAMMAAARRYYEDWVSPPAMARQSLARASKAGKRT